MMVKKTEKDEFQRLLDYYKYTLHELPAGVLYGANGASLKECADLMKGTYELEELAVIVGSDISEFLSVCRWHSADRKQLVLCMDYARYLPIQAVPIYSSGLGCCCCCRCFSSYGLLFSGASLGRVMHNSSVNWTPKTLRVSGAHRAARSGVSYVQR